MMLSTSAKLRDGNCAVNSSLNIHWPAKVCRWMSFIMNILKGNIQVTEGQLAIPIYLGLHIHIGEMINPKLLL